MFDSSEGLTGSSGKDGDLRGLPGRRPVTRIGPVAADLLARGCAGEVLAAVSDAVYLRAHDGEIFWLAREDAPMHARGAACSWAASDFCAGMAFRARAEILRIGEHALLDGRGARLWQPRPIERSGLASREVVAARLSAIADQLESRAADETGYGAATLHLRFADHYAGAACVDIAALAEQSKALIGLGPGLTPAGDDFVGGLFFALYHLRRVHALAQDDRPIDELLVWARGRTNMISHTLLADLAAGQGPEPLHDLLFALLMRDGDNTAMQCAVRLMDIGASTGAQLLAGTLLALQRFYC